MRASLRPCSVGQRLRMDRVEWMEGGVSRPQALLLCLPALYLLIARLNPSDLVSTLDEVRGFPVGRDLTPAEGNGNPLRYFLPGRSHGQRSGGPVVKDPPTIAGDVGWSLIPEDPTCLLSGS